MNQATVGVDLASELTSLPASVKLAWVGATGRLYGRNGAGVWVLVSPAIKSARQFATAAGTLGANVAAPVAPTINVPGAPFGPGIPYRISVISQVQSTLPSGLGVRLETKIGADPYRSDDFTNGGSATITYTAHGNEAGHITDNDPRAVSVSAIALGGTITLSTTGGEVIVEATPYQAF